MAAPYISEVKNYGSPNSQFIEIRVDAGTDVSNLEIVVYAQGGSQQGTVSLGSIDATMNGSDVYLLNFSEGMFDGMTADAFAIVEDGSTVLQFLAVAGGSVTAAEGPAAGMTADYYNRPPVNSSLQSDDGGATYFDQSTPNPGSVPATMPCYAVGTLIQTPDGPRPVETLAAGDLVITRDNGPQKILWVREGVQPLVAVERRARPVLLAAGSLGPGRPDRNLIVSPQHRILAGNADQLAQLFSEEVLVPAKSLTSLPGIRHMNGKAQITWVHFACKAHEIVVANGCLSESLLLGPMVLNGLACKERQALTEAFGTAPTPDTVLNGPPARRCLTVGEVRRKLNRSRKKGNDRRLKEERRKWDVGLAMERYEVERLGRATTHL